MSAAEVNAAKFMGPMVGKVKAIAFTTSSANTDLSTLTELAEILKGKHCCLLATQDVQFCFGASAVTITADHPILPANTPLSPIPPGSHLGLKGVTAAGTLYVWEA